MSFWRTNLLKASAWSALLSSLILAACGPFFERDFISCLYPDGAWSTRGTVSPNTGAGDTSSELLGVFFFGFNFYGIGTAYQASADQIMVYESTNLGISFSEKLRHNTAAATTYFRANYGGSPAVFGTKVALCGTATDANDDWLVLGSSNEAASWSVLETIADGNPNGCNDVTYDSNGLLYAGGYTNSAWTIRSSSDGSTWNAEDSFAGPSRVTRIFITQAGSVIAGGISGSNPNQILRFRKRNSQGNWSALSTYQFTANQNMNYVHDIAQTETGRILVSVGGRDGLVGGDHWMVLASDDEGQSWTLLDKYQLQSGQAAFARSILVMGRRVFIAGSANNGDPKQEAIIRRSEDNGNTWTTAHRFQHVSGRDTYYGHIAMAPNGELMASGTAYFDASNTLGIVRSVGCYR